MPRFETQVLINRPVFQVFRYVGDFNNDVNWRNVKNVGITSGDPHPHRLDGGDDTPHHGPQRFRQQRCHRL